MKHLDQFYINGAWVKPSAEAKAHEVINPATEASEGTVYLAGKADVDAAIQAARDAFEGFAATPLEERLAMLESKDKCKESFMEYGPMCAVSRRVCAR